MRLNLNANYHPDDDNSRSRGMILVCQDAMQGRMKTYTYLYEQVCSWENLLQAFDKAAKRKNRKSYILEFKRNFNENLLLLQKELKEETYSPFPLKTFILRDPKTRKISASAFSDRIVHHALVNVLEPIFEKRFIYDSYANRKGKGALLAVKRFEVFARKTSCNGKTILKAKTANQVLGYVLKADIRHYFETVDHQVLFFLLQKNIHDEKMLSLVKVILNNFQTRVPGKGMPLGNLTSQFFANVYLNELDHFVKHQLRADYYLRYVDDFVIFHRKQQALKDYKEKIASFLEKRLRLELHPQKCQIKPLAEGIDFLGYKIFYHYKLPRKRNLNKIVHRLRDITDGRESLPGKRLQSLAAGWHGYLKHANTFLLWNTILSKLNQSVKPNPACSFNNPSAPA